MKKVLLGMGVIVSALTLVGCGGTSEPTAASDLPENVQVYSDVTLASAQKDGDDVVVFVGASRCPGCVALQEDIIANADLLPEGVTVLTADFDNDTAVTEKYGVEKKHTSIYINPDGEVVKKNQGAEFNIQDIIAQLETL